MEFFPDFGKYTTIIWISYGSSIAVLLALTVRTFLQKNSRNK